MKTKNMLTAQRFCTIFSALAFVAPGLAVEINENSNDSGEKKVQAQRTETSPSIDGEVLNDPAWASAPPSAEFWQTTPDEGKEASEKTEVRVLFSNDTLYFGVVCYDKDPAGIIVSDSRRDASLSETDCFQIILDTFNDNQNGFVFGTNPAGIEYDAQVINEGEGGGFGGRQRGGSGGGFNINWDGSWEVKTKISEAGWSAEFAIPFRTLRFSKKRNQEWGVNFQRNIRRRNERAFWTKLPRQYTLNKISLAGSMTGLEVGAPKNLKVMPYVLGQNVRNYTGGKLSDYPREIGADLKYSLTPSMTLDVTWNTDFAQVEVDEQQINLDRFSLFFPEKRPFFLENAGLFSVGSSGEVEMFFSRRIGLDDARRLVPILGGGRVSGKVGNTNIGLLNMQAQSVDASSVNDFTASPANNFSVVRVKQEMHNRTSIGAMFVNRDATGSLSDSDDYNRTFAVDGRLGLGQRTQLSGFLAKTDTPTLESNDLAYRFGADYSSQAWMLNFSYTKVESNFNPEVGFLSRDSFRRMSFLIFRTARLNGLLGLHEARPHISYRGFWDANSSFQQTGFLHVDSHWEWKNGYEIHTGVNFTKEGVREAFDLAGVIPVDVGTYNHAELQLVMISNQGAPISYRNRIQTGGFFGGRRFSISNTFKFRFGEKFNSEIDYNVNKLDLDNGETTTNLLGVRLSYSFTPRIFLQSLVQYNDIADAVSTNLRFGWLQAANTGLFLVYNETQDVFDDRFNSRFGIQNRSFTIKYSRLLDILQ